MPVFNQKGPDGKGPMTGRKMGRCTNFGANLKNKSDDSSEQSNENLPGNFHGRGFGFGRAYGRKGFGRGRQGNFTGDQQ